jgi:hypothetical protein
MIFNFEHEHLGLLYDVDAETRSSGGVLEFVLLEVRLISDSGEGFMTLDVTTLDKDLAEALRIAADADYTERCIESNPRVFDV